MAITVFAAAFSVRQYLCERCGEHFVPKRPERNRFCGRDCGLVHTAAKGRAAITAARKHWPHSKVHCGKCAYCGEAFVSHYPRKCCCKEHSRLEEGHRATAHKRTARVCKGCGEAFVPPYGRTHAKYCSNDCSDKTYRRIAQAKYDKRMRSARVESVDPVQVLRRDGWRCQLCGIRTPKGKRGTYAPDAPELDHIIPLSCGGEHSYRNTQCACRSCNAAKGDRPLGQLRLVG